MMSGIISHSTLGVLDPISSVSALSTFSQIFGPLLVALLSWLLPGRRIRNEEKQCHAAFAELTGREKLRHDHPRVVYALALTERLGESAKAEAERFERATLRWRTVAMLLLVVLVVFAANIGVKTTCDQVMTRIEEYRDLVDSVLQRIGATQALTDALTPASAEPEPIAPNDASPAAPFTPETIPIHGATGEKSPSQQ